MPPLLTLLLPLSLANPDYDAGVALLKEKNGPDAAAPFERRGDHVAAPGRPRSPRRRP